MDEKTEKNIIQILDKQVQKLENLLAKGNTEHNVRLTQLYIRKSKRLRELLTESNEALRERTEVLEAQAEGLELLFTAAKAHGDDLTQQLRRRDYIIEELRELRIAQKNSHRELLNLLDCLHAEKQAAVGARKTAHTDSLTGFLNRLGITLVVKYVVNQDLLNHEEKATADHILKMFDNFQQVTAHGNALGVDHEGGGVQPNKRVNKPAKPGIILYFDLNNLKKINDKYGHDAGDAYIKAFANVLKNFFRANDFIALARTGGDEFIGYIKDISLDEFHNRLSQLRKELSEIKYEYEVRQFERHKNKIVTRTIKLKGGCAVGAGEITEPTQDGIDNANLSADEDMYHHKLVMKLKFETFGIKNKDGREYRQIDREKQLKWEYTHYAAWKRLEENGGLRGEFQVEALQRNRNYKHGSWNRTRPRKIVRNRESNPPPP